MTTFEDLIQDQFMFGGNKYRNTADKEVTDQLTEDFGWDGLLWTQGKYCHRFRNMIQEKDLLKISCYQFINWLKLGYHLSDDERLNMESYINTTVETKKLHFPEFLTRLASYEHNVFNVLLKEVTIDQVYLNILDLREGYSRKEETLYDIVLICKRLWHLHGFDKVEVHNTDTGKKVA